MTEVLLTETPADFAKAARRAAELLRAGEVVVLPTETVYGLAANALDERAVRRIFEIKGRPAHNPIIVHVASWQLAQECASKWPATAKELAASFWPGPLTMVVPKARGIPSIVSAGGETVGIRWPSHPLMQEVIKLCGFPLAAPSANLSNQISPTTADHVFKQLGGKVPLIVDAGAANVGIESTVIDLTQNPPVVLRPGMISQSSLEAALGTPLGEHAPESKLKSPGMLPRHYSPHSRMILARWNTNEELNQILAKSGVTAASTAVISHSQIPADPNFLLVSVVPHDPPAYARAVYAELHRCDEMNPRLIVCEEVPETPEWEGIRDRLHRASAKS